MKTPPIPTIQALCNRQNGLCHYCERRMRIIRNGHHPCQATKDHKIPRSAGGKNRANLVAACYQCNVIKGSTTYEHFLLMIGAFDGCIDKLTEYLCGSFTAAKWRRRSQSDPILLPSAEISRSNKTQRAKRQRISKRRRAELLFAEYKRRAEIKAASTWTCFVLSLTSFDILEAVEESYATAQLRVNHLIARNMKTEAVLGYVESAIGTRSYFISGTRWTPIY